MPVSPFTFHVTKVLDNIPAAEGRTVTIRMLNGKRLRKAAEAAQMAAVDMLKSVGGASVMKQIQELGGEEQAREAGKKAIAANPFQDYDRDTLIEVGVISWTFDEELNRESIDHLFNETADFIAAEILALAKPKRTEAEQKND